ncbi:MAG TPA: hypothetical protein VKS24_24960 [Bradyrhizobium sp.]|nr:hypothetical protein [Bradyrhizobium sp.]
MGDKGNTICTEADRRIFEYCGDRIAEYFGREPREPRMAEVELKSLEIRDGDVWSIADFRQLLADIEKEVPPEYHSSIVMRFRVYGGDHANAYMVFDMTRPETIPERNEEVRKALEWALKEAVL